MFVILFVFWIIFNGRITTEVVMIGVGIVAAIEGFMVRYMDYRWKDNIVAAVNIGRIIVYVIRLMGEIIQSNINVMKIIVNQEYEIKPRLITFETTLDSKTKKVVLANSITLTPGTITVSIEEQTVTVLCLDEEFANGIEDTVFERQLNKMKGAKK